MKIATKKGDNGKTHIYPCRIVDKDHIRVESCGDLDELCSFLGMSRSIVKDKNTRKLIESVQRGLFKIGSEIATELKYQDELKDRINAADLDAIEEAIEAMESKYIFEGGSFYLPGEGIASSALDVSRAIARRVERRIVSLNKKGITKNKFILIYMNRLSDLLYLLARRHEKHHRKV